MVLNGDKISTLDFYEALELIKTGIKPGEVVYVTAKEKVGKTHETSILEEGSGVGTPLPTDESEDNQPNS
jgi:hypothetical protein